MKIHIVVAAFILSSCIPFKKEPIQERYHTGVLGQSWPQISNLETEARRLREKETEWNQIVDEAVEGFEEINHIVTRKCASCHDSDKPLPFYGRIFPSRNIFKKHRDEGLAAVNFFRKFPLSAEGKPSQLSLLKAVRASIVERTMPIKLYVTFYPFRKINDYDEKVLLEWIDPLIEKIERFNEKYEGLERDSGSEAVVKLFNEKCMRCHGNGRARGGFGGMENLSTLANSKYINKDRPEESMLYELSETGEMPPSESERLTSAELAIMLDWIRSLKK